MIDIFLLLIKWLLLAMGSVVLIGLVLTAAVVFLDYQVDKIVEKEKKDMSSGLPNPPITGLLLLAALAIAVLALMLLSGCADYPVAIAVHGDYGSVSYSANGIQVTIEK